MSRDRGRLYEQRSGVPRDSGLARLWYEKAAVLGDPEAMLSLGVLYENGRGVPTDYEQARQFYESTIYAKEEICRPRPSDCMSSAPSHSFQRLLVPSEEPPMEAFDAQELRQDVQASAVAMNNQGALYYRGLGVQPDYDEARFWLRRAAEQGSAEAEQRLLSLPLQPQKSPEH